jgi:hypothetical protein
LSRKRHPIKEIEAALRFAEAEGWVFRKAKSSSHAFGVMRCPHNTKECRCGIYCQFSVWSTPKSPEAHARKIRKVIHRCIHWLESDE